VCPARGEKQRRSSTCSPANGGGRVHHDDARRGRCPAGRSGPAGPRRSPLARPRSGGRPLCASELVSGPGTSACSTCGPHPPSMPNTPWRQLRCFQSSAGTYGRTSPPWRAAGKLLRVGRPRHGVPAPRGIGSIPGRRSPEWKGAGLPSAPELEAEL
jgi:hypothetical protein